MRVLVTGSCGFVGSSLVRTWLEHQAGLDILGLDNLSRPGSEENRVNLRRLGVDVRHGDLRQMSDLADLPRVDWVVDCAANSSAVAGLEGNGSRQLVENNLVGTLNLLEYCKGHATGLILLSSSRVYSLTGLSELPLTSVGDRFALDGKAPLPPGMSAAGLTEAFSTAPPLSLYGSTKRASEMLALEYGAAFDFPVWINRCGNIVGPGQFGRADQGVIAFWINSWIRNRPLRYTGFAGKGYQVRDCLHPADLASLVLRQVSSPEASGGERIFNVGGGMERSISLSELSRWCAARYGDRPVTSVMEHHAFDVPWVVMDASLAARHWEWSAQISLEDMLCEIASHAENHADWLERSGA